MKINESTRRQLITLCRRGRDRTTDFSPDRPTHWNPGKVRNPRGEFDTHFTNFSAWELIATELEAGCEVETIDLKIPPGAKGYVMQIELEPNDPPVYIKVQLGAGKIIGRSFHYSTIY